jgi:Ca-activated chloride channel family protein
MPESFYIKLAKEMGETGISVMALGLGKEYNEDLLSEIAEHSRGIWKHISQPEDLPAIFSQQLDDTRVVIRVKPEIVLQLSDNVEMKMMYKFIPEAIKIGDLKRNGAEITVPLSDLKLMESQTLVVQLSVPSAPEGQLCLVKVQIADDPTTQQEIMATCTSDENLWGTENNPFPRGIFLTAKTQVLTQEGLSGDQSALNRARELAETILADQSLSEIYSLQETTTTIRQTIGDAQNGLTDEETKVAKQDMTRIRRR